MGRNVQPSYMLAGVDVGTRSQTRALQLMFHNQTQHLLARSLFTVRLQFRCINVCVRIWEMLCRWEGEEGFRFLKK